MGMVWLLVRIQIMNQNACSAACGDVHADRPARATRVKMNGNHASPFNSSPYHRLSPFSHKV